MELPDKLRRMAKRRRRRPELLLCPRVPQPLHGVNPRTVMGQRWWDETRRAAYRSTAFHCAACGTWKWQAKGRKWLEGHEVYEVDYLLGRMTYIETVPLCHYCHNYVHRGRLTSLMERGLVSQHKFAAVVQHGDRVLREAGLVRLEEHTGSLARWEDWRLVLNGEEYPPLYTTMRNWQKVFRADSGGERWR